MHGMCSHGGFQKAWSYSLAEVRPLTSLLRGLCFSVMLPGLPHRTLQTGNFERQKCISHGSGGEKTKTREFASLVPPEACVHGVETAPSLCVSSLDLSPVRALGVSLCVQMFSLYKDSQQTESGHPHSLIPTQSPLERSHL